MVGLNGPDTEQLLAQAEQGDRAARNQLLTRFRGRLLRMIALRLDHRLAARFDPSDIVQDTLAEADQKLAAYLRQRHLPFHAWLRRIATDRLAALHRDHIHTKRRSVTRESPLAQFPDESMAALAQQLLDRGSTPSARLARSDDRHQLLAAMEQLVPADRELLVLRHLESLAADEIATLLGISTAVVYVRHVRVLERLRKLLARDQGEVLP
jgi:RNA polymerase sigma-70 factor (ECF subfamily)